MRSLSFLFVLGLCVTALCINVADIRSVGDAPIVETSYGEVAGFVEDNVLIWRGIPYASAPTGNLRWKPPTAHESWSEPLECTEFGKICSQKRDGEIIGSEDCLFLNIYVPTNSSYDGPLPVRFWIYGGGFNTGDGYLEGGYDGGNIARSQGVIVVTHNYRVGSFGFFGTQELADESGGTTGNYGVQDQTFAMKWINQNIKAFGGDPSKMMIWGQSAGAFSTCFHLASPDSYGLFSAALMESGTCDSIDFFRTFDECDSFSADYAAGFNCSRDELSDSAFLSCLRSADRVAVATSVPQGDGFRGRLAPDYYWGPVIDSTPGGLYDYPIFNIMYDNWASVPFAAGLNQDEGSIFLIDIPDVVPGITLPFNETELEMIGLHFWDQSIVDQLLTIYYPQEDYDTVDDQTAAILRDYIFTCPTRRALSASSSNGYPSWMYHLVYANGWVDYKLAGDYHAFEIPFVFDNQWPRGVHNYTESDQTVADIFGYYWSNLAKSQDINVGFPGSQAQFMEWPEYNANTRINMALTADLYTETYLWSFQCDYWDTVFLKEVPSRK